MLGRKRRVQRAVAFGSVAAFVGACGARTGLYEPIEGDASSPDAHHDVVSEPDADAAVDAPEDAVPPIDVSVDVPVINECPDAGATLVYVIGAGNELFSFYPPTLSFTLVGQVSCTQNSTPFSMAVNRGGTAYSVFSDGELFQVSTKNAACQPTSYTPSQLGWTNFGMGYATLPDGGDSLFVVEVDFKNPSQGLGTIDTSDFTLSKVGSFQPDLTPECELTGTGDGRLFALCLPSDDSSAILAQIDPLTAKVVGEDQLSLGGGGQALAFAFWGGDFWIFTAPSSQTTVTKYDPVTKQLTPETTLNAVIVGAGVSTCAPQK